MSRRIETFADLLSPLPPETFFERNWETEPLHIRRSDPGFYENLLTDRDVEAAISSGGLRYPAMQLARDGGFFPAEAFTKNIRSGDDFFSGIPNLDRVRAEYQSGATISLPGFHRAWRPLGILAAAIEESFDHAVHANVYITPGNAAGFSPHYDTHEVFVLQIAGGKRWRIHKPPIDLPHRSQPFDSRITRSSALLLEVDLAPGDLLYLPRGFVHTTTTSDSFSVHVTLGVTVYTWVDLLAECIQSAKNASLLRRALPPGFASQPQSDTRIKQEMREKLRYMLAHTDFDAVLEGFTRRVRAAKPGNGAPFQVGAMVICLDTTLGPPESERYRIARDGSAVVMEFDGKTLRMPGEVESLLAEICKRKSFRARELPRRLDDEATLAFIRYLHGHGFLRLVRSRIGFR